MMDQLGFILLSYEPIRETPTTALEALLLITSSRWPRISGPCCVPSLIPTAPQPRISTWRVPFPWVLKGTADLAEASLGVLGLLSCMWLLKVGSFAIALPAQSSAPASLRRPIKAQL